MSEIEIKRIGRVVYFNQSGRLVNWAEFESIGAAIDYVQRLSGFEMETEIVEEAIK